jgi:hypothetical protein
VRYDIYIYMSLGVKGLNTVLNLAMTTLLCIHSLDVRDLFSRTSDTILNVKRQFDC